MIEGTINFKKINKQTLGIKSKPVPEKRLHEDFSRENTELVWKCRSYYDSLAESRKERKRARNYHRGRQWDEYIRHPKTGKMIKEEDLIREQGKIPFVQNQVRQLVKNLEGQYRGNPTSTIVLSRDRDKQKATEMMTNALQYGQQINKTEERDASSFVEFLLSGMPIQKVMFGPHRTRDCYDLIVENKTISRMFMNSDITDIQHRDLRLIGEIHDLPIKDLISNFARNKADEEKIRQWYGNVRDIDYLSRVYGFRPESVDNLDFLIPNDFTKCRVIEAWELKGEWRIEVIDYADGSITVTNRSRSELNKINANRISQGLSQGVAEEDLLLLELKDVYEQFWYYKFLTPNGYVLQEGETPYEHQEHPYVFLLYPLIDGENWGFVSDIIDIQRQLNRYIILMDMIINSSAKGTLMVPKDIVPEGMSPDEFAASWTEINGVIFYTPKAHGQLPKQISVNSTNIGAQEMIQLYSKLLTDISGVQGAIQGQSAGSGTPASRYAMEAQNASTNNVGYMKSFASFIKDRDYKMIQLIKQFYNEPRYLAISGRAFKEEAKLYDPEAVKNMAFDNVVSSGNDTPIYRMAMEETLTNLLNTERINLKMYLENSNVPFADTMLESLKRQEEEAAKQQAQSGIPPEVSQAAQQGDPKAMAMLEQAMGRQAA